MLLSIRNNLLLIRYESGCSIQFPSETQQFNSQSVNGQIVILVSISVSIDKHKSHFRFWSVDGKLGPLVSIVDQIVAMKLMHVLP